MLTTSELLSPTYHHALITGGAGFIGSHLAEALLAQGYTVTIIDNLSTGNFANIKHLVTKPNFHYVIDTIANKSVLDRLVSECDVIYHLAAVVGVELVVNDPLRVIETNILGSHAVLETAARYRRKVILASTSEIYGKADKVPFSEDDDRILGSTTKARWCYSDSKAIDEFLGLAYQRQMDVPIVICRFFNTVGIRQTGQYGMVVPRFVQQALRGDPICVYGDGSQSRCFCNVRDVIRAIITLADCAEASGQIFNVGSTQEITILELARKVLQLTGTQEPVENRIVFIPYEKAYEIGFEDMQRRVPDIRKIKTVIGWQPQIDLDETLHEIIAYYQGVSNI